MWGFLVNFQPKSAEHGRDLGSQRHTPPESHRAPPPHPRASSHTDRPDVIFRLRNRALSQAKFSC